MTSVTADVRPDQGEYAVFFGNYIQLVPGGSILDLLDTQQAEFCSLIANITEETANSLHPPYSWSIKQVVGHLIDCERVFGYRAARFAAGDDTPLPSFDENLMVAEMDYQQIRLLELIDEWRDLRRANLRFYRRLSPRHWERRGDSAGNALSVRAIGFILVGHTIHHLMIIRKRLGMTP